MPDGNLDQKFLENLFKEIRQGFSLFDYKGNPCYVKHASYSETDVLNETFKQNFEKVKEKGLLTEEELLKMLDDENVWSKEDEASFDKKEMEIENLKKTMSNLIIQDQKKSYKKRISQLEEQISDHKKRRAGLVKNTAEEYASKKSNEAFMFNLLFKDKELKREMFSKEEFNELSRVELGIVFSKYNGCTKMFTQKSIRQLSIESTFTSMFNLFGQDVSNFYGKNVFLLSYYQINLLNYGQLFHKIFENKEIPKEIIDDAEKILDYLDESETKKKAARQATERAKNAAGFSYKGASKEDLEKAGINTKGTEDIHSVAKRVGKGGDLTMEEFMEIHKK
jgi:hypothetical protein